MAYAEEHVGYTRTGYHGRTNDGRSVGRYEAGEGLVWTQVEALDQPGVRAAAAHPRRRAQPVADAVRRGDPGVGRARDPPR